MYLKEIASEESIWYVALESIERACNNIIKYSKQRIYEIKEKDKLLKKD